MKNGISLMNMCIIVAIIFIVATICVFIFKEANEKKQLNSYISQMELIQEKVNFIRSEYKTWYDYNPNETGNFYTYLQSLGYSNANDSNNPYIDEFNNIIKSINEENPKNWNENIDIVLANYCYFSSDDLKKYFNIDNIDFNVIVNFYTGNIISKEGIKENKKVIYRQYDSKMGNKLVTPQIYNLEIMPKFEVVENQGLTQRIKISLENDDNANIMEVYYYVSKADENKKMCSKLNGYQYKQEENSVYFNIETSGEYIFIVEDTNFVQYPQIEYQFNLCNPPQLLDGMIGIYWEENGNETRIVSEGDPKWYNYSRNDFRMANAKTEDGNYWVWVPRFLFKKTIEDTDIEFVKGKTNIATNNMAMNGYQIHETFSKNGEIEGFWISKFQGNFENNGINFKPGKTLTLSTLKEVKNKYKKLIDKEKMSYVDVMSNENLDSIITISEAVQIEITNDFVHYAGGSPDEDGFKENVRYSSTNNIYGIYDLVTSENEITKSSKEYETGRFRLILIK